MAEKKRLRIVGANCGDFCEAWIRSAVMKIPGVKGIRVNCKAKAGEVEYDPERTHIVEIVKAIRGTGHECMVKVI
ncbi:MAG TPA: heavy-metal-associated domain-containing protein [archaeon]|jgi:copper chaperone CopZ|nr:heavy-metal-associated domain-containing protein [archaeon]